LAPSSSPSTTSDVSIRDDVTTMIGSSLSSGCDRTKRQTSSPPIPGMTQSSKIRFGRAVVVASRSITSAPSVNST
jgi:hypothetical protein